LFFSLVQFRAAWRRIRGKDKTPATVNETTINQISESSSKAYIECSFVGFEKKKKKSRHKDKKVQNTSLISLSNKKIKNINETLGTNNNNNLLNNSSIKSQVFKSPSMVNNEIKYVDNRSYKFPKDINRNENNYELRMFSSEVNIYGKTFNQLIRADSYRSNLC
jgi:hypothetical protein